jgi:RNA polymerase sigma-70 factor (ECF subfamily)
MSETPPMSAAPRLSPVPDDDATLVARAVAGDERAFTTLYRRHARYVAGVAFRLMGDESELDDIVQETFVAASAGLAKLTDRAALRPWLVTIAVRSVSKRIARRQRSRWLASLLGRTEPIASAPAVEGEAYALYEALAELSAELRVPWALHAIEGMTLPDVAERCGVSLATVKRRIKDAGELLAKRGVRVGGDGDER